MNDAFIHGFVKRAADYGVSPEEAETLLKQAERPYGQEQAAKVRALDELIEANKYNRENHPGHYYLNPFVGGPISELVHRYLRRTHAFQHKHPIIGEGVTGRASAINALLGNDELKETARNYRPGNPETALPAE